MSKRATLGIIFFISCLTFLVWHKLLNQTFFGEGFYYFDPKITLGSHDNFAVIFFRFIAPLFRDNFRAYFLFQIVVMILLNVTLFYLVDYFTKSKFISLISSIFFLSSYLGLFEMFGTGNYQRFVQRVANLIPLLFSFIYFSRYLQIKRIKHYLISIFLFSASLLMGHFSTFLLPLFIIYPIIVSKSIKLSIPFVVINLLLISQGSLFQEIQPSFPNDIWYIIKGPILQLANLIIPPFITQKIASLANPYENILIAMVLPVIILSILAIKKIKANFPQLFPFYVLCLTIIPILFLLNIFLGKVDPLFNIRGYNYYFIPDWYKNKTELELLVKGDRYYLLPSLFISSIGSILLTKFFSKKVTIFLTVAYLIYNINLIWGASKNFTDLSSITTNYLSYIKSISAGVSNNSVIVTDQAFIWPAPMIRRIYNLPGLTFVSKNKDWETKISKFDSQNVFILNYDPTSQKYTQYNIAPYKNNQKP